MKTFAYIYTRSWDKDFRIFTKCTLLPKAVETVFDEQIKSLLNDCVSIDSYKQPTWLFSKQQNCILWGVSCNNDLLSKDYTNDKFGREVPCFCGVIYIDYDDSLQIPYSIEAFKPVFNMVMSVVWKPGGGNSKDTEVSLEHINPISATQWTGELNHDDYQCRLFSKSVNDKELIAQCLFYYGNISIAVNVSQRNQVCDNKGEKVPLMNAVMRKYYEIPEDVLVKEQCPRCGKWTKTLTDGVCSDCKAAEEEKQQHSAEDSVDRMNIPDNQFVCRRCGKAVVWIGRNGVCGECIRKRKKLIIHIVVWVILMLSIIIIANNNSTSQTREKDKQPLLKESKNDNNSDKNDQYLFHDTDSVRILVCPDCSGIGNEDCTKYNGRGVVKIN